jgi:hypothetical protein
MFVSPRVLRLPLLLALGYVSQGFTRPQTRPCHTLPTGLTSEGDSHGS